MLQQQVRDGNAPTFTPTATQTGNRVSLSGQLAQHSIEDELLQGYPRLIKAKALPFVWFQFIGSLYLAVLARGLTHWMDMPWIATFLVWGARISTLYMLVATIVRIVQRIRQRYQVPLLRYGKPVPAIVIDIDPCKKKSRLEFAYTDRFGEIQIRTMPVSTRRLKWHGLQVSSAFTVLLSREKENDVLPYFLADEYQVALVEATTASRRASKRMATLASQTPSQSFHPLGTIEPELLGNTPRHVRSKTTFRQIWWCCFAFATLATAIGFCWTNIQNLHLSLFGYSMFLLAIYVVAAIQGTTFPSKRAIHGGLLQNGAAVRAKVCSLSHFGNSVSVLYEYETKAKETHRQSVSVTRRRFQQLGITEGATFTVLYFPHAPATSLPYFALDKAEIVDAIGAKVTPAPVIP